MRPRSSVAAAVLACLTAVVAIAGCGGESAGDGPPPAGSVVVAGTSYAPTPELVPLIAAAARNANASLVQRDPAAGASEQLAQLRPLLGGASGLRSVVVGAIDPAATERLIAGRKPGGPAVVSILNPLKGASATIALDPEAVSARITRAATAWARRHGGIGDATVLVPPDQSTLADWSVPAGRRSGAALVDALTEAGFAVTTLRAVGEADARAALGDDASGVLVGWNDATALGAAAAARGAHWVAAAGAPAPGSAAREALRDGRLDLIVATRLTDLADAIVRSSGAAKDQRVGSGTIALPVRSFTRG